MTVHALLVGAIVGEVRAGTSAAKGLPWARALVRVGEGAVFISVVCFGEEAAELEALGKGDAIAASGRLEFGSHQKDGVDVPSYSLVGARVLTVTPQKRKRPPRPAAPEAAPEELVDPFADLAGAADLSTLPR